MSKARLQEDSDTYYVDGPRAAPVKLASPPPLESFGGSATNNPVVSRHGDWLAYSHRPEGKGPLEREAVLRSTRGKPEISVALDFMKRFAWKPLAVDETKGEVLVGAGDHFASFSLDGRLLWGPVAPPKMFTGEQSFRRVGDGWVAWDLSTDGPYRVVWDLPSGKGKHEVLAGRSIHRLAVEPGGRHFAYTTNNQYRNSEEADIVRVVRTSDGATVFKKNIRMNTAGGVAFLGEGIFAHTEGWGDDKRILVYRLSQ